MSTASRTRSTPNRRRSASTVSEVARVRCTGDNEVDVATPARRSASSTRAHRHGHRCRARSRRARHSVAPGESPTCRGAGARSAIAGAAAAAATSTTPARRTPASPTWRAPATRAVPTATSANSRPRISPRGREAAECATQAIHAIRMMRRPVQQRCHRSADQAGTDSRRHSPHHHRTSGGRGEQVGGYTGDRDAAEERDEHRCDSDLRADRHGEGLRERARSRHHAGDQRRQAHDADARSRRQLKPDHVHEKRIDQHQPGHGEREQPCTRRLTPEGRSGHRERGHRGGAQHGGLEARQQCEEPDHCERRGKPDSQTEPAQHRPGQSQDERDVLPRNGEQMREPGATKVVGDVDRLASRVAEHESKEQRTLTGGKAVGAAHEEGTQPVGGAHPRCPSRPRPDVIEGQHPDDVSRRQPCGARWRTLEPTHEKHAFSRLRDPKRGDAGAPARDRLNVPAVVEAYVGAHPRAVHLRIGEHGGPALEWTRRRRHEAGSGTLGQTSSQHERADHQHDRSSGSPARWRQRPHQPMAKDPGPRARPRRSRRRARPRRGRTSATSPEIDGSMPGEGERRLRRG